MAEEKSRDNLKADDKNKSPVAGYIFTGLMIALCVATVVLEMIEISYTQNALHNRLLNASAPLLTGFLAVFILARQLGFKLFHKPEKLLYLLPCLAVAVNNFQFCSFFAGNMKLQDGVDTHGSNRTFHDT